MTGIGLAATGADAGVVEVSAGSASFAATGAGAGAGSAPVAEVPAADAVGTSFPVGMLDMVAGS